MGRAARRAQRPSLRLLHLQRRRRPQAEGQEHPRRRHRLVRLQVLGRQRPHLVREALPPAHAPHRVRPGQRLRRQGADLLGHPQAHRRRLQRLLRVHQARQVHARHGRGLVLPLAKHPHRARPRQATLGATPRRRPRPPRSRVPLRPGGAQHGRPRRQDLLLRLPHLTRLPLPRLQRRRLPHLDEARVHDLHARWPQDEDAASLSAGVEMRQREVPLLVPQPQQAGLGPAQPGVARRRRGPQRPHPLVAARDRPLRPRAQGDHELPQPHRAGRPHLDHRDQQDRRTRPRDRQEPARGPLEPGRGQGPRPRGSGR